MSVVLSLHPLVFSIRAERAGQTVTARWVHVELNNSRLFPVGGTAVQDRCIRTVFRHNTGCDSRRNRSNWRSRVNKHYLHARILAIPLLPDPYLFSLVTASTTAIPDPSDM